MVIADFELHGFVPCFVTEIEKSYILLYEYNIGKQQYHFHIICLSKLLIMYICVEKGQDYVYQNASPYLLCPSKVKCLWVKSDCC